MSMLTFLKLLQDIQRSYEQRHNNKYQEVQQETVQRSVEQNRKIHSIQR